MMDMWKKLMNDDDWKVTYAQLLYDQDCGKVTIFDFEHKDGDTAQLYEMGYCLPDKFKEY